MRLLHATTVAATMLMAMSQQARADVERDDCPALLLRCSNDDGLAFEWHQTAFDGVDVDTGWLPADSNVQARFAVRLLGNSEVSFDAGLDADWDESDMRARLSAEDNAGWVSVGYGLEIAAQLRFNVSVFGQSASWTGALPTPFQLPSDLLVAAESEFTPWRLPGAVPESVTISDETGRINAFVIGLSDDIIDIPGIGGHFALQVAASLQGEYRDQSVAIDGGTDIEAAHIASILDGASATQGYGPALTTAVRPRGRLEYTPGVTLYPNIRLVVFGFTVFNADLFTLHLDLPSVSSQVDFDEATARLPLPDLHVDGETLHVGDGSDAELLIENRGEKALLVDIADWPEELEPIAPSFAIEPGSSYQVPLQLRAESITAGLEQRRTITLHSNDPDAALTMVEVEMSVAAGSDEDDAPGDRDPGLAALDDPSGCGCRTSGGPGGSALPCLLAFGLLAWRRRRSQR